MVTNNQWEISLGILYSLSSHSNNFAERIRATVCPNKLRFFILFLNGEY